jgi:hypothetical protein
MNEDSNEEQDAFGFIVFDGIWIIRGKHQS